MANTGVTGKVQDLNGSPIQGVLVVAFDAEISQDAIFLGSNWVNAAGNYTISYSKWDYGVEHRPDIIIRVYDRVCRLIYESIEYPDVSDPVYSVPTINIRTADSQGWLVTLLTGTPTMLSSSNVVTALVDNKSCWKKLTDEVKTATTFVNTCQLYIDAEKVFTAFTPPDTLTKGTAVTGERFEEEIYNANLRIMPTRIIMNDFTGIPYPFDTADKVVDYYKSKMPHLVEVRLFARPTTTPMHAKFTVIDAKVGILNASPILQEYYDDTLHEVDNHRRGAMGIGNAIKVPVHDVSVAIEGKAIEHLQETFDLFWRHLGGTAIPVTPFVPPSTGTPTDVQIVRTLPGALFTATPGAIPKGELGIIEAYQRAFRYAQSFIYLENQYITSPDILQSLLYALVGNPQVQAIILTNNKLDLPKYQSWQPQLIKQFLADAKKNNVDNRVAFFTKWTHLSTPTPQRIIRNYVHSKVGIVDDKWATVGSANLDGISLFRSQHLLLYVSATESLEDRACELNAVIYNGVDGRSASTFPDDLRKTLWAEHLGISPTHASLSTPPSGGWLKLWKDAAAAKLAGLKATPPTSNPATILEWGEEASAKKYLAGLGVKPSKDLTIEEAVKNFDFSKGDWA